MKQIMTQKKNKRMKYNIVDQKTVISQLFNGIPQKNFIYKLISTGNFGSLSIVAYIAEKTHINDIFISTLTIGKQNLQCLSNLQKRGLISHVNFLVNSVTKQSNRAGKQDFYKYIIKVCKHNNWNLYETNNRSKIVLLDTEAGKFVIETSANFNGNPKMEQYSVEINEELFEFYKQFFENEFVSEINLDKELKRLE